MFVRCGLSGAQALAVDRLARFVDLLAAAAAVSLYLEERAFLFCAVEVGPSRVSTDPILVTDLVARWEPRNVRFDAPEPSLFVFPVPSPAAPATLSTDGRRPCRLKAWTFRVRIELPEQLQLVSAETLAYLLAQ